MSSLITTLTWRLSLLLYNWKAVNPVSPSVIVHPVLLLTISLIENAKKISVVTFIIGFLLLDIDVPVYL